MRGCFFHGKLNGTVRAIIQNAFCFGYFVDRFIKGKAELHQINDFYYKGTFENNLKSGNGVETHPDGKTFIGKFENGKMGKIMKIVWEDESKSYEGEIKNYEPNGEGKQIN